MAKINGEEAAWAVGLTVAEVLARAGYRERMLAVECNGAIVPRAKWESYEVRREDALEVVRFVGGG